jgi:hypothetical protein
MMLDRSQYRSSLLSEIAEAVTVEILQQPHDSELD